MNASSDTLLSYPSGILSLPQLEDAFAKGILASAAPLADGQIQPASLDLRLGAKAWRVQASFLPGADHKVTDKLADLAMHEIDLTDGAVLEKGCVYIAELMEQVHLPDGLTAIANPKSSTGRLDVFTRMIADYADEFEMAPAGYSGTLYAEISPRTFSVLVRQGSRLSQLRLRSGVAQISDADMTTLQDKAGLTHGTGIVNHKIKDGIPLSVDLSGQANHLMPGLVGWRARKHAGLIDVDQVGVYPVSGFWEKVTSADLCAGGLVLNPDEFYILASQEYVTVPAEYAAEMTAYDTRIGEF
ncbi:MAG: 2'-deoxycytidine 5'-triphosphate deaminase, partial [Candidatus Puniceispirillales bacterium]